MSGILFFIFASCHPLSSTKNHGLVLMCLRSHTVQQMIHVWSLGVTFFLSFLPHSFSAPFGICGATWLGKLPPLFFYSGGRKRFGNIWIFTKFLIGFRSFTNPSFQDLNGSHIMYWNMMILNLSRFKVEPHSKYWYFCIERVDLLSLRFSENAVLFHI